MYVCYMHWVSHTLVIATEELPIIIIIKTAVPKMLNC